MKLNNIKEVEAFFNILSKAKGSVILEAHDNISGATTMSLDLSSELSRFVALSELIKASRNKSDIELELFCRNPEDEALFCEFLYNNEDAL